MESYEIIKRPLITEKTTQLKEKENKYVFIVDKKANKYQIARAVEEIFKVKPERVTTMVYQGKVRRLGRYSGRRPDWKKAVVKLKTGQEIKSIEESK
ncbi:MAG: 50S ribosomal protein L23 [Elusimicrobiota bacterium]